MVHILWVPVCHILLIVLRQRIPQRRLSLEERDKGLFKTHPLQQGQPSCSTAGCSSCGQSVRQSKLGASGPCWFTKPSHQVCDLFTRKLHTQASTRAHTRTHAHAPAHTHVRSYISTSRT